MAIDGMDEVPNTAKVGEGAQEINKTRQYIADRTAAVTPIAKGGTGATDAAGARTNLQVPWTAVAGLKFTSPGFGRISFEAPGVAYSTELALYSSVQGAQAAADNANNNANNRVAKGGDTMSGSLTVQGHVYIPNRFPVNSGPWYAAWINSDGRIGISSSARRFKESITELDPEGLGDIWPQLVEFRVRGDDTRQLNVGYIADDMAAHPDQARWVQYDQEGEVQAYDYIQLLLAQCAQLHQRVLDLERKAQTDA